MKKVPFKIILISFISILVIATVSIAYLSAIYLIKPSSSLKKEAVSNVQSEQVQKKLRTIIIALDEQNKSGQSGTATLQEVVGGKVLVKISLIGPNDRVPQPAHIHVGSCPNPAAVKYELNKLFSNISETTIDVSMDALLTSGKLAINIHKSQQEPSVYTACGNLPEVE